MRLRRIPLACTAAGLLVLAGCGGGDSGSSGGGAAAAGGSTSGSAAGASSGGAAGGSASGGSASGGSASAGGGGGKAGCPSVGRAIPQGARSRPTIDVDGDGRPDTEWIAPTPDAKGGVPFGIRTASGAVFSATITSASPVARSVMFADVTGKGEIIALASDGRQVLLYAVSACQIIPEKNAQGRQYAFDLGFTGFGTGVGCVDADGNGTTDLVGLKYVPENQGTGTIQRTIVTLTGPNARNGATDTVPASTAALADEAQTVSCGDLTLAANGVTTGP
jgi:hypothetical protein